MSKFHVRAETTIQEQSKRLVQHILPHLSQSEHEGDLETALNFVWSNFKYHKFLSPDSNVIARKYKGLAEKFNVNAQYEKEDALVSFVEAFLSTPLLSFDLKSDRHYGVLGLLAELANSPTSSSYFPKLPIKEDPSTISFNRLVGELACSDMMSLVKSLRSEELIDLGSRRNPLLDDSDSWSDLEEDDALSAPSYDKLAKETNERVSSLEGKSEITPKSFQLVHVEKRLLEAAFPIPPSRHHLQYFLGGVDEAYIPASHHFNAQDGVETPLSITLQPRTNQSIADILLSWQCSPLREVPLFRRAQFLNEEDVLREALFMLSGTSSYLFNASCRGVEDEHGSLRHLGACKGATVSIREQSCVLVRHLTQNALKGILDRFCVVGTSLHVVRGFVQHVFDSHSKTSLTYQSLAKEMDAILEELQKEIFRAFGNNLRTLLQLDHLLQNLLPTMNVLRWIVGECVSLANETPWFVRTAHLLDRLYECLAQCDVHSFLASKTSEVATRLLRAAVSPFLEFIDRWVSSGELRDVHDEFFIEEARDDESPKLRNNYLYWTQKYVLRRFAGSEKVLVPNFFKNIATMVLIGGKSVHILSSLDLLKNKMAERFPTSLSNNVLMGNPHASPVVSPSTSEPRGNNGHFGSSQVSKFLNASIHKVTVKSSHVVSKDPQNKNKNYNINGVNSDIAYKSNDENGDSLSEKEGEQLFSDLFVNTLKEQISLRCNQGGCLLVGALASKYHLARHLAILRGYFLMDIGDILHHVCVYLFEKSELRGLEGSWRNMVDLNGHHNMLLRTRALDPFCRRIVFELRLPSKDDALSDIFDRASEIDRFDDLSIFYPVKWPIDIVLPPFIFVEYNKIFRFLVKVKRAKWALDTMLHSRGVTKARRGISSHKVLLFRSRVLHVVHTLHDYIFTRILHSLGVDFQEALSQARSVDDMVAAHGVYLSSVQERCLLSEKTTMVHNAIMKILSIALQIHILWRDLQSSSSASVVSERDFELLYGEFHSCVEFVVSLLGTLARRGAYPHLETLWYSLSPPADTASPPPLWEPAL